MKEKMQCSLANLITLSICQDQHYKTYVMPLHMPIWEPTVALLPLNVGQLKEEEVQVRFVLA